MVLLPLILLLIFGGGVAATLMIGRVAITAGASPIALVVVQNLLAGLVLSALCVVQRRWPPLTGRLVIFFAITSLLGIAIPYALSFLVLAQVGAAVTSLVYLLPPLLTYVFAVMAGLDRHDSVKWLALAIGVLGASLALGAGIVGVADASITTLILAVMSPTALSIGNVYRTKAWPIGIDLAAFSAGLLVVGAVWVLALAIAFDAPLSSAVASDTLGPTLINAALTAVAYLAFSKLQLVGGPVYLSQAGIVIAVAGVIGGGVLLGERPPPEALIGALIVCIALGLATWRQFGRRTSPAPTPPG